MNQKVAFIFDMDGVIVDSNPAHKVALKQFCRKYGHDLTEDELREKIYGRRNADWIVNVFGPLGEDQLKRYAEEKEDLFRQIYARDIRPVDGLPDFLKSVREENIPRAIATSAPGANVDFTLARTGLGSYFDTILDDTNVSNGKPHPEVYLKAANALGFQASRCVVFEDSLAGVKAGKDAGCKVVGITTTHSADELSDTDLVIGNFVGLDPKKLIFRLFQDERVA